jgi:hypothetical protein
MLRCLCLFRPKFWFCTPNGQVSHGHLYSITFALKITSITYSMLGGEGGVKREVVSKRGLVKMWRYFSSLIEDIKTARLHSAVTNQENIFGALCWVSVRSYFRLFPSGNGSEILCLSDILYVIHISYV